MCDCRDDEDEKAAPLAAAALERLARRARAVERRRPGEAVPEALWPVFFGEASGAIPWHHHARMVACRDIALGMIRLDRTATKDEACFVCSA